MEEEVEGVGEEDLEEHRVVEESIELVLRGEEEVHHVMEDYFKSLCEDRVRAWLRAKNKVMKAATSLQIPDSRFHDMIREVLMSVAARRKAAWEARAAASTSGCNNHFAGKGPALNNAYASSSSALGSSWGSHVLDNEMHQAALAPARAAQ
jgi:hypothetical protein